MKDFCLSDKMLNGQKILDSDRIFNAGELVYFFELKDVKEAVRLLKGEFQEAIDYRISRDEDINNTLKVVIEKIDKIFGDELTKDKKVGEE